MPSLRIRDRSSRGQSSKSDALKAGQNLHMLGNSAENVAQPSHFSHLANPDASSPSGADFSTVVPNTEDCLEPGARGTPPAANTTPPEILLQIYSMLAPRDFDNARRTCSQWMRVSLNRDVLEIMLKRAGWWDAYRQDVEKQRTRRRPSSDESDVWRMSRRFATECLLAGRKANIERPGFVRTETIDFSRLAPGPSQKKPRRAISTARDEKSRSTSTFSTSSCGNYVLVTTGCRIYVFRLLSNRSALAHSAELGDANLAPITSIECPFPVLSAILDTSKPQFIIAALLGNRVGMVCDLDILDNTSATAGSVKKNLSQNMSRSCHTSPHYYYNVCSEDHPPRTIALYPGRRCVAFGCAGGIEIHWVDQVTKQDHRRHFPMSQPSETLHFLPNTPDAPSEMRLISSLAGPGKHECACRQSPHPDHPKNCQFNILADFRSFGRRGPSNTSSLSLVRATHCHHYRAVPINDGYHIIFVEPRTGFLCIGSDSPIGGPTSLTRAFVCVPPFEKDLPDNTKEARSPTVFTVGSDLKWGLRVVAAYQDRIILYSVPLDVFNVIRKERERQGEGVMGDSDLARDWFVDSEHFRKRRESLVQNQNGDWEFLLSVTYRPTTMMWPFKIYGKEIGRVDNIVELALQSENGGARVWAFDSHGKANVFDIDTYTTNPRGVNDSPCRLVTVGSDGSLESARLVDRSELDGQSFRKSRKRKASQLREEFLGQYGVSRFVPDMTLRGLEPMKADSTAIEKDDSSIRRPSFAACIVDFKIPELGTRNGRWRDDTCAS